MVYKPGSQNIVADALSRQQINQLTDSESQHSQLSSPTETIRRVGTSLNHFNNQIIIQTNNGLVRIESKNIFGKFRHTIYFTTIEQLISDIKGVLHPNNINAIITTEEILYQIKTTLVQTFPTTNFVIANALVRDITDENEQNEIVEQIHRRAHRNYRNNIKELSESYYWPNMQDMAKKAAQICEICKNVNTTDDRINYFTEKHQYQMK